MNDSKAVEILAQMGAILSNGHFVYPSGDHSSVYIEKHRIYEDSASTNALCWRLADHLRSRGFDIETVVGAKRDRFTLAYATARQLSALTGRRGREVSSAYADKTKAGTLEFGKEFEECIRNKKVLIMKDVITTGATVRKLARAVTALGGKVVAAAALCNRGGVEASALFVPALLSLTETTVETYPESDCPLCARGEPIRQDAGRGREYVERKQRAAVMAH